MSLFETFEHAQMAESLKVKRSTSKSQFTRCEKRLNDVLENPTTIPVATIERRYNELSERWNAAQCAHDAYLEVLEAEGYEVEEEESWMDEITKRFDEVEIKADAIIEKMKQPSISKSVSETVKLETGTKDMVKGSEDATRSLVQLERIKLDKFDGDIRKYPKFREQFECYVKPLCTSSQLPFVLRSHLSDTVRAEVDNTDDNLETLWTRLDKKYGNRSKQLDAILADIQKAP